jgi:CheY-like chemotaxis protein
MASILLVDDDEVSRHVVRKMIERDGHQVEEAGDGEAALAAMDAGLLPDCIVLDLMMPRVGGVDVLRRMRSDARWQQIPVLLMTSLDDGPEVDQARTMGFRRHFIKAYWHADDLLQTIEFTAKPASARDGGGGVTAAHN